MSEISCLVSEPVSFGESKLQKYTIHLQKDQICDYVVNNWYNNVKATAPNRKKQLVMCEPKLGSKLI